MKPNPNLILTLLLSGVLVSCSSIDHHSAIAKNSSPDLYLHLYASFLYPEQPRLIVSAPIQLSSDFDIPMEDNQRLKGRIEPRSEKQFIHFQGRLCSGTNVFNGEVELEKRYEPWPEPYDNKAPFICQPHFILSSNSNPKPFLKRQAAAEKKRWNLENPLTIRQLVEVKRQFRILPLNVTEDELFSTLGLSRYRNRLLSGNPFSHHPYVATFQLGYEVHLTLWFDRASPTTNRNVVEARLGTEIWSKKDWFNLMWPAERKPDAKHDLLTRHLDTVTLNIAIHPFASGSPDPAGSLRSILIFSGPVRTEPNMMWHDGTPATGDARLSKELMLRILEVLDREDLFSTAETFYGERTANPKGRPPAKKNISSKLAQGWNARTVELRLDFFEGDYYTHYIISVPWAVPLVSLLTKLRTTTAGSNAEPLFAELLKTYERFK